MLEKSKLSPATLAKFSVNSSVPLPVLVKTCDKVTTPFGLAVAVRFCSSVKLPTCKTVVLTSFDVTVRVVDVPSTYDAVAMLLMFVPAAGAAACAPVAKKAKPPKTVAIDT